MKNFFKNILRWLNLMLVVITLLAYLSPFINPVQLWPFSFLGLAYPVLLLSNILFIVFWLWRRNKYFLYSATCILVGLGYFSGLIGFNLPDNSANNRNEISVMTYNVAGLRNYNGDKESEKSKMMDFEGIMEDENIPDILCIQEGAQNNVRKIVQQKFNYPFYFKEKGTLIFSKYKFSDSGVIPFENTSNSCIWGDLEMPGGTLRVYAVHLQSNWLAPAALRVVEEGDPRKKELWRAVGEVMRLYKRAATRRANQAKMVAAHMAESPHPVILCGDLNDTPVSYVYQVLSKNLKDSFCEKGLGFDFTYAGKIPGLRIDYVLTDKQFEILEHQVPQLELSDHYPVLVRLVRE